MKIARRWRTSLQPKSGTGLENELGQPRPFRLTANTFCSSYLYNMYVCICTYVYIYMYVCMHLCMYVCIPQGVGSEAVFRDFQAVPLYLVEISSQ